MCVYVFLLMCCVMCSAFRFGHNVVLSFMLFRCCFGLSFVLGFVMCIAFALCFWVCIVLSAGVCCFVAAVCRVVMCRVPLRRPVLYI